MCVCVGGGGSRSGNRTKLGGGGGFWDCNVPPSAQGHLGTRVCVCVWGGGG